MPLTRVSTFTQYFLNYFESLVQRIQIYLNLHTNPLNDHLDTCFNPQVTSFGRKIKLVYAIKYFYRFNDNHGKIKFSLCLLQKIYFLLYHKKVVKLKFIVKTQFLQHNNAI